MSIYFFEYKVDFDFSIGELVSVETTYLNLKKYVSGFLTTCVLSGDYYNV